MSEASKSSSLHQFYTQGQENAQTWIAPESSLSVKNASFPNALRATILPATDT